MRVSAKAQYACIAVLELAAQYGSSQPSRVRAIAQAHGIPVRFLVQILLQLKGAGLVASTRGAAGGYQLTRSPESISLGEVINAVDRPQLTLDEAATLSSPAARVLHKVWQEIQAEELRILEQVSLADLQQQLQESGELSYQI
jgi:Rrf2 family protein